RSAISASPPTCKSWFPPSVSASASSAPATLHGGQLQVLARLTQQLDLTLSYGYLHTEYDSFENALIGDLTGNKFAQAPENTFDISLTWRQPMPTGELWLNASYGYISE